MHEDLGGSSSRIWLMNINMRNTENKDGGRIAINQDRFEANKGC